MREKRDFWAEEIPLVNFKDVTFSWPGEKSNLISKCNFSIDKPGLWMIVGSNGSGKSTFLKLINGILKPNTGEVYCNANVGMVFQNPDHQILMPIVEVSFFKYQQRVSNKEISIKIRNVLQKLV